MGQARAFVMDYNPGLMEREIEILQWIADGKDNNEIADLMKLPRPQTVQAYVQRIMDRTGTASRSAAVAWALRRGLIK